jgi:hypothetical protein
MANLQGVSEVSPFSFVPFLFCSLWSSFALFLLVFESLVAQGKIIRSRCHCQVKLEKDMFFDKIQ